MVRLGSPPSPVRPRVNLSLPNMTLLMSLLEVNENKLRFLEILMASFVASFRCFYHRTIVFLAQKMVVDENLLNNKTITLLNLVEYHLILNRRGRRPRDFAG